MDEMRGNCLGPKRKPPWVLLAAAGSVACVGLWVFWLPLFAGNFGVVDPGRVYRSAQPTHELKSWIQAHGIRSVLNLRGGSRLDAFYRDELRVTRELGVEFYDIAMSATDRPDRGELLALIDVFKQATYPLLIHCKQGADRTGLASTLYYLLEKGEAPERAARGFTLRHAHVPLFGPERLHEPLNEYRAWLQARALTHTPHRFAEWVAWHYQDEEPKGPRDAPVQPGPRPISPRRQAQLDALRKNL